MNLQENNRNITVGKLFIKIKGERVRPLYKIIPLPP